MTLRLTCAAILVLVPFADAGVYLWELRAFNLAGDFWTDPDPYVKVWCGSSFGGMTDYVTDNSSPSWKAEFNFPNCNVGDTLKLEVWDSDLQFDDHLFTCIRTVVPWDYSGTCQANNGGRLELRVKFQRFVQFLEIDLEK